MAAVTHVASLDEVAAEACPYPSELLPSGGTGLCLFAAGFLGQNDAIHMERAGMRVTCVDTDAERLAEMSLLYPSHWTFIECDAWRFTTLAGISEHAGHPAWDVVSVDNFTGEIEPRVLASLPLWCSLARRMVTVTIGRFVNTPVLPEGWQATRMHRSPLADWLVLTRD